MILGSGKYLPKKILTNEEISKTVNTTDNWTKENLGIKERRIKDDEELSSHLGYNAVKNALVNSDVDANEVDILLVATATPDRKAPSTACIIKNMLGLKKPIPAFDINAVCSGFLYAQTLASQMLQSSNAQIAVIVGVDIFSSITNWESRDCVFFGDGAGALVVKKTKSDNGLFSSYIGSESTDINGFTVFPNEKYFSMDGKLVFSKATNLLPEAVNKIMDKNGLNIKDVNYIIPHQPSIRALDALAEHLGIKPSIIKKNMYSYANTASATVPILFAEFEQEYNPKLNEFILFLAVGSGWTFGAALYKWK
jgi:3-oxoacyl-[acyl-carrier-protein] synthase III